MKFARFAIACTAITALAVVPHYVGAQDFNVLVDATAVVFDQPPIEREGRLYVPLRGIFERLGAKVAYSGGRIEATAGAHAISLQIGQSAATVDGASRILDAPAFVIAGRTLVPLRFISQALGATVDYQPLTHTVSIVAGSTAQPVGNGAATTGAAMPPIVNSTATPVPEIPRSPLPGPNGEVPIVLRLLRLEPSANATLVNKRPEISATFAESVAPGSVRVSLDGRDVTAEAYISARSFVYDPSFDLAAGAHGVQIGGKTPDRESFLERWTFTTRDGANSNYISGLEPPNGVTLGSRSFDISGFTYPKSRVRIVATTNATIPTFSDAADGSTTTDAVANFKGFFEVKLALADRGTSLVDVRISSTAPDGGVAVRTLRLRL